MSSGAPAWAAETFTTGRRLDIAVFSVAFCLRVVLDRPVEGRFWVTLLATLAGIAVAIGLLLWLIGATLLTWGVLGTLIVIGGILLVASWVYDRRQARNY